MRAAQLGLLTVCLASAACSPPTATTTITGPATLPVGATAQYTATVTGTSGGPLSPGSEPYIQWSTTDGSRATVTQTGLVTAVAPGSVTLIAQPVYHSLSSAGRLEIAVVQ